MFFPLLIGARLLVFMSVTMAASVWFSVAQTVVV